MASIETQRNKKGNISKQSYLKELLVWLASKLTEEAVTLPRNDDPKSGQLVLRRYSFLSFKRFGLALEQLTEGEHFTGYYNAPATTYSAKLAGQFDDCYLDANMQPIERQQPRLIATGPSRFRRFRSAAQGTWPLTLRLKVTSGFGVIGAIEQGQASYTEVQPKPIIEPKGSSKIVINKQFDDAPPQNLD